ncbi:MAG: hypothetical protein Q4P30_04430 [Eubacteriales bacterium]|nr:hypothetical protein [Eubacteriales bacterium]
MINVLRMEWKKLFILPRRWFMVILFFAALFLTTMRWTPWPSEPFGFLLPWLAAFAYCLAMDERCSGFSAHLRTLPGIRCHLLYAKLIINTAMAAVASLTATLAYGFVTGAWQWQPALVLWLCEATMMWGITGMVLLFRHRLISLIPAVAWSSGLIYGAMIHNPTAGDWLRWVIPVFPVRRMLAAATDVLPPSAWSWCGYMAAMGILSAGIGFIVDGRRAVR